MPHLGRGYNFYEKFSAFLHAGVLVLGDKVLVRRFVSHGPETLPLFFHTSVTASSSLLAVDSVLRHYSKLVSSTGSTSLITGYVCYV